MKKLPGILATFALLLLAASCSSERPIAVPTSTATKLASPTAVPSSTASAEAATIPSSTPSSQERPETAQSIYVPSGNGATIDGVFSPNEWDKALKIELANGELLLMHDGTFLNIGIRSDKLGLGSVCVYWDDEISILHSSAALGTATYVKEGEEWLKTRDFYWTNRDTSNSQQALAERSEQLEEENWLASNGLMGNPDEMEYQIGMSNNKIHLAVTYLLRPDFDTTDYWPDGLGPGCRNFEPLPGDAPESVHFDPESWITVMASKEIAFSSNQDGNPVIGDLATVATSVITTPGIPTAQPIFLDRAPITPENAADVIQLHQTEIPDFLDLHETCGVAFSPDGKYLAAACRSTSIPLLDVTTGEIVHTFGGSGYIWTNVAFSPDGKTLASSGRESAISMWDVETGGLVEKIRGAPGYMSEVIFSPDGGLLASGSFLGSAMLWDVTTNEALLEYFGHHSRVNAINFSPDGRLLVTGGGDNQARVWQASSGEETLVLSGATHYIEDVEFSPNGLQIVGASDNSRIYLWDAANGDLIETFLGHDGPVNGVTYSPDGRLLASTSNDRTLRLWDVERGENLAWLAGHSDLAIRSAFNPDGSLIATVSWDGTVRLWGLPQ